MLPYPFSELRRRLHDHHQERSRNPVGLGAAELLVSLEESKPPVLAVRLGCQAFEPVQHLHIKVWQAAGLGRRRRQGWPEAIRRLRKGARLPRELWNKPIRSYPHGTAALAADYFAVTARVGVRLPLPFPPFLPFWPFFLPLSPFLPRPLAPFGGAGGRG